MKIIQELENIISKKTKIILFFIDDVELFNMFVEYIDKETIDAQIWHDDRFGMYNCSKMILLEDVELIMKMYYLYEFTDNLVMLSYDGKYSSIYNYINEGIFTKEEMVRALLY